MSLTLNRTVEGPIRQHEGTRVSGSASPTASSQTRDTTNTTALAAAVEILPQIIKPKNAPAEIRVYRDDKQLNRQVAKHDVQQLYKKCLYIAASDSTHANEWNDKHTKKEREGKIYEYMNELVEPSKLKAHITHMDELLKDDHTIDDSKGVDLFVDNIDDTMGPRILEPSRDASRFTPVPTSTDGFDLFTTSMKMLQEAVPTFCRGGIGTGDGHIAYILQAFGFGGYIREVDLAGAEAKRRNCSKAVTIGMDILTEPIKGKGLDMRITAKGDHKAKIIAKVFLDSLEDEPETTTGWFIKLHPKNISFDLDQKAFATLKKELAKADSPLN